MSLRTSSVRLACHRHVVVSVKAGGRLSVAGEYYMAILVETAPAGLRLRRWPWAVATTLLLAATVATARATYLFWLPCRGSMTRGLIFTFDASDASIPDACLQQMDAGTPFPYAPDDASYPTAGPVLAAVAMVLTGLAFLTLVLGMRWRLKTRAVATVPALLSLGLALSSVRAALPGAREVAYPSPPWWLILEVAAVGVLVVVRRWQPEVSSGEMARLTLILWGVTAFGVSHEMVDYMTMSALNTWNWDCPPGCGYPTAVAIGVATLATGSALLTRRSPPSRSLPSSSFE
jgi:hypothetical protein